MYAQQAKEKLAADAHRSGPGGPPPETGIGPPETAPPAAPAAPPETGIGPPETRPPDTPAAPPETGS
jgi:hypothetical protein